MKVIVRCVPNRITKADMEKEIERLFQENKDLRVSEGHLQDEVEQLKSRLTTACADRDSLEASFKRMTSRWEEVTREKTEVKEELQSTQIEIADRDERVFILEQRIEMLKQENEEWRNTVEQLSTKIFNQNQATTQEEVIHLQNEIARLTNERDASVNENSELIFKINELQDKLEVEHNLRVEAEKEYDELERTHKIWGEEIDRLRKVVTDLQTNRFTTDEFIGMMMRNFAPSTDK